MKLWSTFVKSHKLKPKRQAHADFGFEVWEIMQPEADIKDRKIAALQLRVDKQREILEELKNDLDLIKGDL